jgi:hypothetical protein
MTENQIHLRAFGQTLVEVEHLEATPLGNSTEGGQLSSEVDRNRRDIDGVHIHPA